MIPYLDLRAQYRALKPEIDAAVLKVLESGEFVLGTEVARLEEEFADYCGARFAVGVNSGTSALHLSLLAAGVGPGDEVITPPFTFVAATAAIRYTGATPVFADIDPRSFNIDPRQIESKISPRTKALLPVHLFGQPAEMDAILAIAQKHRLVLVEDAAQAHGAEYRGRRTGSLGDLAAFSFYPTKNLGACGEAGMVTTNDAEYARRIRLLRDWGAERKYHPTLKGYNYRMEALQGAVLRVKLQHLEQWIEARREHARTYTRLLGSAQATGRGVIRTGNPEDLAAPGESVVREFLERSALVTPCAPPHVRHVYSVYSVLSANRQSLIDRFRARQIQFAIHYPVPIHLMEAHADLGYHAGDFPVSEEAANRILALPIYPEMTAEQIEAVANGLKDG